MSLSLSLAEARRLALAAQGFHGRRTRRSVLRRHMREMLARLVLIQIVSVNALVRS
ncbi:winged helix-turn-helix domain-containing protein, partial [Pseudomonas aeruginosa]